MAISYLGLAAPYLTISGRGKQRQADQIWLSPGAVKFASAAPHFYAKRAAPVVSSLRVLCHFQRVINVDAQVSDRTFNFGVTK